MNRKSRKSRSSNFRSGFEEDVAKKLQPFGFTYEPRQVKYTVHRKYTPDFERNNIIVEAKGYLRPGDTQKYKAIRDSLEGSGQELVFVLMKPNQRVNKTTKLTMCQWCDKEGLKWYTLDNLEELLEYVNAR